MRGKRFAAMALGMLLALGLAGCQAHDSLDGLSGQPGFDAQGPGGLADTPSDGMPDGRGDGGDDGVSQGTSDGGPAGSLTGQQAAPGIDIIRDMRPRLDHGPKGPEYQRYIVLHDTEGWSSPQAVIDYWDGADARVAAHFVVGTDGSVYQCVPLDRIAHHAGFGDAGQNAAFGVLDESRDDRLGTAGIGQAWPDYGMNSYSVGIELVHVGGSGDYPSAQLDALDGLIAHIDAYFGFQSTIIDHKMWYTPNPDTSPEFAGYLANYRQYRSHRAP